MTKRRLASYGLNLVGVALLYALITLAFTFNVFGKSTTYIQGICTTACYTIIMVTSLNLVVGFMGEFSMGHAGFVSVGAYVSAIVSGALAGRGLSDLGLLLVAILAGGLAAGIMGVAVGIPALRLRGDYLAIVTLAFGEIIRNVMNCLYFAVSDGKLIVNFNNPRIDGTLLYNGPAGAVRVGRIATFEAGFVLVLLTLFVVLNLINSRSGRAIMASRDNRIAAEAMGVNVTKYKLMAFVTSAALAGMAGALFGLNYSTVAASKFKFDTSILVLVFVVLGGIGNIRGSVIAAALLTILPELLRAFSDYRMLVYAIVLILVMLLTNNPQLAGVRERLTPKKRPAADPAKGGDRS